MLEVDGEGSGGGNTNFFASFSFRSLSKGSIGLRYKHPLEWTCDWNSQTRQLSVRRPTGSSISFQAVEGSAEAPVSGNSRKLNYRVRLLNEDKSPCTEGEPTYLDMVQSNGRILRFSTVTGKVVSLISSCGVETTAEDYAQKLQVNRHPATGAVQSIWSQYEGLLQAVPEDGRLILQWYTPDQVQKISGSFIETGTPYKTVRYQTSVENGVNVMHIAEQREGMPIFHTERRVEGSHVTIIQGEGDEQLIHTIERNLLPDGKWEMIENKRRINEKTPSSCTRTVKKNTEGGWLTLSRTEGYNTPSQQTTLYTYNDQFRVSLELKPDGGYTRYEYDEQGRVTLEATPWAGGGEKGIRTTYADLRFNDFRPATETEVVIAENGEETELLKRTYTYEDTPQVNRTTVRETALGSDQVHTRVEETYGEEAEYPYARGRKKLLQGIAGVQTVYSYEATTDYRAIHKLTTTIQANGSIIPGQSTRNVQYIAENGTATRNEQYVHTGKEWSLVSSEDYEYDAELNLIKATKGNGRSSTTEWMCCGPLRETDEDGITTSYGYNSAKQLVETIRSATETTPETITSYSYDAAGRTIATRRDVGPMTTVERTEYDDLGTVVSSTDILGRVTRTHYSEDRLTTTVITPSGATLITRKYYDGTILWQGGTGQRETETRLELTGEGILTTTLSKGVILSRSLSNGFNQPIRKEQPNSLGKFIATKNTYNDKRQLTRIQIDNMAPTVITYSELGIPLKQATLLDELYPDDPTKNQISKSITYYRAGEDGIYQIETSTNHNEQGLPLIQHIENMVSQLSPILEEKTIATDIYGQRSIHWTEYTAATQRTQFSSIPTSSVVAETRIIDGFTVSQTSHAGIHSSQNRSYTSAGMILKQTDSRGNITTIETDLAGRPVKSTDAAGNLTATRYQPCCDAVARITDARGGTACYSYDVRGRKTAAYGTAIQPACFTYDEADHMVTLTTFRADEGDITTDPSGRTDGDTTTWLYDEATGLELNKTYADGSCISKTYDGLNRLETLTKARGVVTTYAYAPLTGELVSVYHNDATAGWEFTYNHLGQITSIRDASGLKELSYNNYGRMTQETSFGTVESCLQEEYDAMGRSEGYRLMLGTQTIQYSHLDYDSKGAIIGMNLEGLESPFTWQYDPTSGFLNHLTYPNGMVRQNTYHPELNLVTTIGYKKGADGELAAFHEYNYDGLMRPTQRQDSWDKDLLATIRDFTYNDRSELVKDRTSRGGSFIYSYDNIGNRKTARELQKEISYRVNPLNQYTNIINSPLNSSSSTPEQQFFDPVYDADGNQITIKTSTGIWNVSYDAHDRPVRFTSKDGRTIIACGYDYMGRRFSKKVTINGSTVSHLYYLYRDYLQIAHLDLMHSQPMLEKSYLWDPTEPTATRILMTQWKNAAKQDEHLYFMHDVLKNVTSIFGDDAERRGRYEYAPFGDTLTAHGKIAQNNKFRFSCEYMDEEMGLIYYNYRHLNPLDGRWISRDPLTEEAGANLFVFVKNNGIKNQDYLGRDLQWWIDGTKHNANLVWQGTKRTATLTFEKIKKIDREYKVVNRATGVLQVVGGGFEATAGAIGIFTPEPVTTAGGVVLFVHGSDVASTGIRVIITGEFDSTMTYKAIVQGAESVGVPTEAANSIAAGAEVALGAKAFTTPATKCCPKVLVESTEIEVTTVSRWGSDLTPNSWVMEGTPTVWNYMWSGKWQPGLKNLFAPVWNVRSYVVPKSSLSCPTGKGLDGFFKRLLPAKQRIYTPPKK